MSYHRQKAAVRAILVQTWPHTFAPKGAPKKPLALGIGERIILALPELGFLAVSRALTDYTDGPTYLRSCVEGAPRIDLDGVERGAVTASEAQYAASRIASMLANAQRAA